MGRSNSIGEQRQTLAWARNYHGRVVSLKPNSSLKEIAVSHDHELKGYFALAGLSRSLNAPRDLVHEAWAHVFQVRVRLEDSIARSVKEGLQTGSLEISLLLNRYFFGASKKQGVSLRMPLTTCQPTKLCAPACYAHDVLDAAPAAVVRGVVNGIVAELYEGGGRDTRWKIMELLQPSIKAAILASKREVRILPAGWRRRPKIRFAHVGEIACFPEFANDLAYRIQKESHGKVDSVAYTRLQTAYRLNPELFVVNFTLDKASENRRQWIPDFAKMVFSAFGGKLSPEAEVNFLEHHRWSHSEPTGNGWICPATAPGALNRTCDACHCDRCFKRNIGLTTESIPYFQQTKNQTCNS
jgi:hypothetical protein